MFINWKAIYSYSKLVINYCLLTFVILSVFFFLKIYFIHIYYKIKSHFLTLLKLFQTLGFKEQLLLLIMIKRNAKFTMRKFT